ncbi:ABC transporter permease [Pseudonocardia eucalypti]|uniref:ABC transporter permease n=1 Tax=Pseudonocardia eucalypti TaxID=648755 RepID=A0ABP9R2E0_9PSEU|nr:putative ABC transport system permease protein [Pseudonocardia eucalypti]
MRSNRLRSLLTTMGIVIGVGAVIVLVALGNGMQAGFDEQFSRLANQLTVSKADGMGSARDLTDQDVEALKDKAHTPDIASVTPTTGGTAVLSAGQATTRAKTVGAPDEYLDVSDRSMAFGSWISRAEQRSGAKVAVIGQDTVSELWGRSANLAEVVGQEVRIGRTPFKVIGVLARDKQQDKVAIVPMEAARAYLTGSGNVVEQIIVKATGAATVPAATEQVNRVLDSQHRIRTEKDRDFNVRGYQNMLDRRNEYMTFLTVFTTAVAAISLVVGGIGVANIMLVSVTERTREIGIRKAIGAPRRAILKQFLIEAVVLTGLGGLAGVAIGVGLSMIGSFALPKLFPAFPVPIVTMLPVLVAFGVSLAIGVVAGGYPAHRAARLRPIEALRFE